MKKVVIVIPVSCKVCSFQVSTKNPDLVEWGKTCNLQYLLDICTDNAKDIGNTKIFGPYRQVILKMYFFLSHWPS